MSKIGWRAWLPCAALLAISCTYVNTRGDGWVFCDLHPLRDTTAASFESASSDGSMVRATLNHEVRPEGESSTWGTVRSLGQLGILTAGFGGTLLTGSPVPIAAGAVASEALRP